MIYMIFIKSNNRPRTINTPATARTYCDVIRVEGKAETLAKVAELKAQGAPVYEVRSALGSYIQF